jgi:hypothetical protein
MEDLGDAWEIRNLAVVAQRHLMCYSYGRLDSLDIWIEGFFLAPSCENPLARVG